jgi:glycosyltransferase involved in cell wall biosynthesis
MAEAMILGKPVITTNYSGNIDFTKEENSFLVDYQLISLEKDYGPYKKDNIWAEPNIDKASYYMKYVFENQKEAKNKGIEAKKYIEDNLSPKAISKKIEERLNKINQEYIHI